MQMAEWKQHESLGLSCNVLFWTTTQACGMFSRHDLGRLIFVNSTTYPSVVHPIMLMEFPNGDVYFQRDHPPCRSGIKNMREILPSCGGTTRYQSERASVSRIHNHQNWTVDNRQALSDSFHHLPTSCGVSVKTNDGTQRGTEGVVRIIWSVSVDGDSQARREQKKIHIIDQETVWTELMIIYLF